MIVNLIFVLLITTFHLLYVSWTSDVDDNHFERKQWFSDHSDRFKQRSSVAIIVFLLDPLWGIFSILSFWAFFDLMLNWRMGRRGLDLLYRGSESKIDQKFKNRTKQYIYTKVVSVFICVNIVLLKLLVPILWTWHSILN